MDQSPAGPRPEYMAGTAADAGISQLGITASVQQSGEWPPAGSRVRHSGSEHRGSVRHNPERPWFLREPRNTRRRPAPPTRPADPIAEDCRQHPRQHRYDLDEEQLGRIVGLGPRINRPICLGCSTCDGRSAAESVATVMTPRSISDARSRTSAISRTCRRPKLRPTSRRSAASSAWRRLSRSVAAR